MSDFLRKNWLIILTECIIITIFCVFYGRFGNIVIDSFREAYIPEQMLNGKILYKNIFCIYPPLAYLINAFLYKIFGISLSTIYCACLAATMGIFFVLNKICRMFFKDWLAAGINLFLISGLVLSPNVFNSFFPYSCGILYGLLFALISIYLALTKKIPWAYLFCSLAICSKVEFLLLLPALIFVSVKKDFFKNLGSFILPIVLTMGILFVQGVRVPDILTSLGLIQIMGQSQTLREFYTSMGLVPIVQHIPLYFINFFKFLLPFKWNFYQGILVWVFPFISLLFIIKFKHLDKNKKFFIIASVLISLKVFFAVTLQSYGVYYLPFVLVSVGILFGDKLKQIFAGYLIIWALVIGFCNIQSNSHKDFAINNEKGIVYTSSDTGKNFSEIISYAKSLPEDSIVAIYPEGLIVNYFSGRKSDDKFYSLIPLYVETFGEENIIRRLENIKPDNIIIVEHNTFAYGRSYFGKDYAFDVMNYIEKNYKKQNLPQIKALIYKK